VMCQFRYSAVVYTGAVYYPNPLYISPMEGVSTPWYYTIQVMMI